MISRRGFVRAVGGTALAWPLRLEALEAQVQSGGGPADESFWRFVRTHFLIPRGRIYLNNGTLGPSPRIVLEAVEEHGRRVAMTYPPGVAWDDLKGAVAGLIGGSPPNYVFPRNTTEAMSFVANGLDLAPGDEILTTDHEHIGGLEPWRSVVRRKGLVLRVARLPVPATDNPSLVDAVWEQVTDRTRVVSVSHMTFTNGTLLPVRDLSGLCRARNVLFVVDGAHPPGMMTLDVDETGADFYASSPHKWLLAPQGTGLLYMRPPWDRDLWPSVASGGWDDESLGAHRLNHMGSFDESRLAGLLAAVRFHHMLKPERTEARVRYLSERLRAHLAEIPGLSVTSPVSPDLGLGMVSFVLEGVASADLQRHLTRRANVRTRVIGEYELGWMRLSTHVYNSPDEVDTVAELIDEAARGGL